VPDVTPSGSPCPNCGHSVPPNAPVCQHCGALNVSPERQGHIAKKNRTWLGIMLGLVGCAVVLPLVVALGALAICSGLWHNYH